MNFKLWLEEAFGDCFRYAGKRAVQEKSDLYHGLVTNPMSEDPPYWHAWVEIDGTIYDWQCMKAGCGGKYCQKGYPREVFYELFNPKNIKKYSNREAIRNMVQSGHWGPWE